MITERRRAHRAMGTGRRAALGVVALVGGIAGSAWAAVSEDVARVAKCQQACADGNAVACSALGFVYEEGLGVPKDAARAATLYRQACDQGNALGCLNLGRLNEEGLGVSKDLARAALLYERACDGRSALGCSILGRLHRVGSGVAPDLARAAGFYQRACDGENAAATVCPLGERSRWASGRCWS